MAMEMEMATATATATATASFKPLWHLMSSKVLIENELQRLLHTRLFDNVRGCGCTESFVHGGFFGLWRVDDNCWESGACKIIGKIRVGGVCVYKLKLVL